MVHVFYLILYVYHKCCDAYFNNILKGSERKLLKT